MFSAHSFLTCQCVYESLDLPCNTCRESNTAEPCVKAWGPKTERAQSSVVRVSMFQVPPPLEDEDLTPDEQPTGDTLFQQSMSDLSGPISNYDSSIDSATLYILQRAYLEPI